MIDLCKEILKMFIVILILVSCYGVYYYFFNQGYMGINWVRIRTSEEIVLYLLSWFGIILSFGVGGMSFRFFLVEFNKVLGQQDIKMVLFSLFVILLSMFLYVISLNELDNVTPVAGHKVHSVLGIYPEH